jgi:hypothetical protein
MKYYVICGDYNEFSHFIHKKSLELFGTGDTSISLSHFVYVDSADRIRGISNPRGWFYGNWKNNSKIEEIMIQLAGTITDIKRQQIIRDLWKEYRKE